MHPTIRTAIESAAEEQGQPAEVIRQLLAWFQAVSEGSESFEDLEVVSRRCDFLYESVVLRNEDDE